MEWKVFWKKVVKGAVSGFGAGLGTLSLAGIPISGHGLAVLAGSVGSAVLHGVANVLEQKQ